MNPDTFYVITIKKIKITIFLIQDSKNSFQVHLATAVEAALILVKEFIEGKKVSCDSRN